MRKSLWLLLVIAILIGGWYLYRTLNPAGPILDEVANPIVDKSSKDWSVQEAAVERKAIKNVYFGDLHVHTRFSFDSFIGGSAKTASDAYKFGKGEEVTIYEQKAQLIKPLDFAAVTDHAEFIGEMYSVINEGAPAHNSLAARYFRDIGVDRVKQQEFFSRIVKAAAERKPEDGTAKLHFPFFQGFETTKSAWSEILEDAEEHYEPGKFTTLAGYEWTKSQGNAHHHRNILFRDMTVPIYPPSAIEIAHEDDLWRYLDTLSTKGSTAFAIPHNSNLSEGGVFGELLPKGDEYSIETATLRNKYEPLLEIHQVKGNSEVHPAFWNNDEFADFESHAFKNSKSNYARYALKRGLKYQEELGINPFKFGIIASTDNHLGAPGNAEEFDEFIGNKGLIDALPELRDSLDWILGPEPRDKVSKALNPGGLVAVWAPANTRGEIFDGLRNKETYATSGTRIQLRFFQVGDYDDDLSDYDESMVKAYANGKPMGTDIASGAQAPKFMIWAIKDNESANLDRVQVIKGYLKDGEMQEEIYNVLVSDDRVIQADGSVAPLENRVNLETGAWDTTQGAIEMKGFWTDPSFDPAQEAFYYVRVLEVPTARWSTWDVIRYGSEFPEGTPATIQERAWSSPIWYEVTK